MIDKHRGRSDTARVIRPALPSPSRLLRAALGSGLVILAACHNEIEFDEGQEGDPACQILEGANLDFGSVRADGSFEDRVFSIRNIGGGRLAGTIRVETPGVTIVGGGGFYSLAAGQLRRVTVRFQPETAGDVEGQIMVGHTCRAVFFQGRAETPQSCAVVPQDLDFGAVLTDGSFADRTFTITNPGPGEITGSVTSLCDAFTLVSGGGDYTLPEGGSRTVTVRFQPTTAGAQDCLIETGTSFCADVRAVAVGEGIPSCSLEPSRFDFGVVNTGTSATATFTITNSGGGTISGTVSESCPAFSIVSGGGEYDLASGESHTVTVMFAPVSFGADSCVIDLGAGACTDPVFLGQGDSPPLCELSQSSLDFGTLELGTTSDETFTIRNAGGGTLSGNVSEACPDFSILEGSGGFTLGPGAVRTVTVRFQPASSGLKSCTIQTGVVSCPGVSASGTGEEPPPEPVCETSVSELEFASVLVGQNATLSFTITNAGGGTLEGFVEETCPDFSIQAGGGAFSLGAGLSKQVTVRFQPVSVGEKNCTITLGTELCTGIAASGLGDGPPVCQVSPTDLDFGNVPTESSAERSFTITNAGGGTLTGNVTENCNVYTFTSGGGSFSLGPLETRTVVVRFAPIVVGRANCGIGIGTFSCTNVQATGVGQLPTACQVSPLSVDYGTVTVGTFETQTITIRNTGGGALTGNVTLSDCTGFSIQSGGGPFSLGGTTTTLNVVVRFTPAAPGVQNCTLETGASGCPSVSLTATGQNPPACEIEPTSLDFGTVTVNTSLERTFTIRNTGGGTLSGIVSESCPDFSIPAGGGAFNLAAGAEKLVTVRFTPASTGTKNCTILTGNDGCPAVTATGFGEAAPSCDLAPPSLAFGTVPVGSFADQSFTITNDGGGTLTGNITEGCPDYSITANGGEFSLEEDESRVVNVRFQPLTGGDKPCTIQLGTPCGSLSATGRGDPPPACSVAPTSLNFGDVTQGQTKDLVFTITNTGGGTLNGNVTESCAEFSIVTGAGAFSLSGQQSRNITIRFAPTSTGNNKTCTIETGQALCADVSASGNGVAAPSCQLSTNSLNFGTVTADGSQSADRSFTITNTGGGNLTGTVGEACSHYTIIANSGAFSLAAQQSRTVTVRYQPSSGSFGTHQCTITTGSTCGNVSATGTGAVGFQAHVRPLIVGSCALAGCHVAGTGLPDFRVYATASSPTYANTGNPSQSLILLKPSFQANPDGLHGGGAIAGWSVGSPNFNTMLSWIQQGVRP